MSGSLIREFLKLFKALSKACIRYIYKPKIISVQGVKIDMHYNQFEGVVKKSFYTGLYENPECIALQHMLKKDDIVMDIGAGIGFLSSFSAKRVGSDNVFSYEANPSLMDKIGRTYEINNVHPNVYNVILSDKNGSETFYVAERFWASSMKENQYTSQSILVDTIEINNEIKRINPSLLIMDIEGAEKEILPLIDFDNNTIKKIVLEVHPRNIGEEECTKVINFLLNKGFTLSFLELSNMVYCFYRN